MLFAVKFIIIDWRNILLGDGTFAYSYSFTTHEHTHTHEKYRECGAFECTSIARHSIPSILPVLCSIFRFYRNKIWMLSNRSNMIIIIFLLLLHLLFVSTEKKGHQWCLVEEKFIRNDLFGRIDYFSSCCCYKRGCRTDFSCFKSDNFPNACQIESEFATQIWLIYFARQQPFTLHFECERGRKHASNISKREIELKFLD